LEHPIGKSGQKNGDLGGIECGVDKVKKVDNVSLTYRKVFK
jgi:hypothetical protein